MWLWPLALFQEGIIQTQGGKGSYELLVRRVAMRVAPKVEEECF